MVTIRKLAELAGVSHMTVWNVLHDKPGVSPDMRARIQALADMHHYRPNRLAEGLLSGNTRTIGLIIESVAWHFYSRLCDGIMNAAFQHQAYVIALNLYTGKQSIWRQLPLLVAQLIEQRVDGIIIAAGGFLVPMKSVLEMWSHDIVPVLLLDTPSEKPLDRIEIDEHRLVNTALDYLLHQGHQRIVYCGFDPQRIRNQEMRRAFHTRGISLDYFLENACMSAPDPRKAEEHLDAFLRMPHPPTAVICYNDQMATQLLLHAQQRGLRVPGDLSILGCSNDIICRFLTPALTSIEQFPEEMGARAYELIQRRRREGEAPGERTPETICMLPQLVLRESCGPPASRRSTLLTPGRSTLLTPGRSTLLTPGHSTLPAAGDVPADNGSRTTEVTMEVQPEVARLLPCCLSPQGMRALMLQLGLRNAEHFRLTYLLPALNAGFLERTIPDKPRSCRQQYRLTAKGRAVIQR